MPKNPNPENPVEETVEIVEEAVVEVAHEPVAHSVEEACRFLGVSEITLNALVERGDYPVERDADGEIVSVLI